MIGALIHRPAVAVLFAWEIGVRKVLRRLGRLPHVHSLARFTRNEDGTGTLITYFQGDTRFFATVWLLLAVAAVGPWEMPADWSGHEVAINSVRTVASFYVLLIAITTARCIGSVSHLDQELAARVAAAEERYEEEMRRRREDQER